MIIVLQVLFVLMFLFLLVLFVIKPKRKEPFHLTDQDRKLLESHVKFYQQLNFEQKKRFEDRLEKFLNTVRVTGVNTRIENIDKIFIGAAAIIPVFAFQNWEYNNLHEVLVYPEHFNEDFDQQGWDRDLSGMVGSGAMQNVMIISQPGLRYGFYNHASTRNTAIHEFAHLIDKVDGSVDGIPEILLPKQFVAHWQSIMQTSILQIQSGYSDIDPYAATNGAEFFAVICEYFFQQPNQLQRNHLQVFEMMMRMFKSEVVRW